jgi:hypothetical protein
LRSGERCTVFEQSGGNGELAAQALDYGAAHYHEVTADALEQRVHASAIARFVDLVRRVREVSRNLGAQKRAQIACIQRLAMLEDDHHAVAGQQPRLAIAPRPLLGALDELRISKRLLAPIAAGER